MQKIEKPLEKKPQLLFAPFKGLTDRIYRNAQARHFGGFDMMYAPFVSGVGNVKINPSKLSDVIPINKNIAHTVPQFISTDAKEIILLGKTLQDYGYDHINWNLGCPFSKIANKKRGCGILPYPDELNKILDQVFKELPIKLSVKTRLGYYQPSEIDSVLDVLNQYPLELLIIHARVGTQLYSGEVNLVGFEKCIEKSVNQIAYNGDVFHLGQFRYLQKLFPTVNHWMLGRGALLNPALAVEVCSKPFSESEKRKKLKAFLNELLHENLEASKNPQRIVGYMKAIWFYLSGSFENPNAMFNSIKKANDVITYNMVAHEALQGPLANPEEIEKYYRNGFAKLKDNE